MSNTSQMDLLSYQAKAQAHAEGKEEKAKDKDKNVESDSKVESQVLSVSAINKKVKGLLEGQFSLVWVRGEISNFKAHSSGHFYFSLKDAQSQINAVMFKGYNRTLKFKPKSGDEVIIRGRLSVYEPRGSYQLYCETMEPVGAGALQAAFEKLKTKLRDEGCFDPGRKRALPILPRHVALVTSPTGAAVRDMLNVLGRRFAGLQVTVVPCQVQGKGAEKTIVDALEKVEALHRSDPVDVVICGRGGGSIEDLWAFNEEVLARKIMAMSMPIVSAVGHEIDFTIADFVADLRAPTPSAAAELVVKNAAELRADLIQKQRRLLQAWSHQLQILRQTVQTFSRRLVDPKKALQDKAMRCDDLLQRLQLASLSYMRNRRHQVQLFEQRLIHPNHLLERSRQNLETHRERLNSLMLRLLEQKKKAWSQSSAVLQSLSPLQVVERGYSISSKAGKVLKSTQGLKVGESVDVRLARGEFSAQVTSIKKTRKED